MIRLLVTFSLGLFLGINLIGKIAFAAKGGGPRPQDVHIADVRKTSVYMNDGVFVGGDAVVDNVSFKNIRHSNNSKFERVVLDIEGNQSGLPAELKRPPYYQIAMEPDRKRIMVTVWGAVGIDFNKKQVIDSFKKSALVKRINVLPQLETDRWSFVLDMKKDRPIEVFELSQPTRVVLDIKK